MKHFLLLIFVVGLCACNDEPEKSVRKDGFTPVLNNKEDSLYHDVMEGHDIGMAKIGTLRKQLNRVTHELDSMNKLTGKNIDQHRKQALIDLQEDLSYADHAMFTWMQEFDIDSAKSDRSRRLEYLESEKNKVQRVKENILNSLQRADSLFGK
ncbi:MAG TPA: hypothetical protein VKA49_05475 [Flavitalea sp.]|nr:hypothetical protein [Flavitalea sp.]